MTRCGHIGPIWANSHRSRALKTVLVVALAALLVFVSARLARVENRVTRLQSGMCRLAELPMVADLRCLKTVETRTSWVWHLYYALTD